MSDYICNACGMRCGGTCYQPMTNATGSLKAELKAVVNSGRDFSAEYLHGMCGEVLDYIEQLEARAKELEEENKKLKWDLDSKGYECEFRS